MDVKHEAVLKIFQSTLPMRGATVVLMLFVVSFVISIHAPHAGSDRFHSMDVPKGWHFNPRSPCGERPLKYSWILPMP